MNFFPIAALEQCNTNMRYILDGESCNTLAELEHQAYRNTAAGVSVHWRLIDGSILWCGSGLSFNPAIVDRVCEIGVSSIVEGSDAEVPVRWFSLIGLTPQQAHQRFLDLCEQVSAEAEELFAEVQYLAAEQDWRG